MMKNSFQRLGRKAIALLVALSMVTTPNGAIQQVVTEGQRSLSDLDVHTSNSNGTGLKKLKSELFEDFIDLDKVELYFCQVGITLRGISELSVEFVRFIESDPNRPNFFSNSTSTWSGLQRVFRLERANRSKSLLRYELSNIESLITLNVYIN